MFYQTITAILFSTLASTILLAAVLIVGAHG